MFRQMLVRASRGGQETRYFEFERVQVGIEGLGGVGGWRLVGDVGAGEVDFHC